MTNKPFTDEERAYIAEHYHNTGNTQLAKILGRSKVSIFSFAKRMGLKKDEGFISPTDNRIKMHNFSVIADGDVVFVGTRTKCAEFIGVSVTTVRSAIDKGKIIHDTYTVRLSTPEDTPTKKRHKKTIVKTDAMDWPLWFFKEGLAPNCAVKYGKVH